MKIISIVVPTFDQAEFTVRCFRSIAESDGSERVKVLWIDNASQESELRRVRNSVPSGLDVELVRQSENTGFVKATNAGIRLSTAPFVLLLNNDTELPADWQAKMLDPMNREPRIGIVGPLSSSREQWQGDHERIRSWGQQEDRIGYRLLCWPGAMLSFFCALMRRTMLEDVGLLDEDFPSGLAEDDWYCHRARHADWFLALRTDLVVKHAHRSTFHHVHGRQGTAALARTGYQILRRKKAAAERAGG